MKIIPLHPLEKGFFTIVDDEDYDFLVKIRWSAARRSETRGGYHAIYNKRDGISRTDHYRLARILMDAPPDLEVNHINQNTLDNRRENLRLATTQQNQFNRKLQKNNKSGFKGVVFHDSGGHHLKRPWRVFIQINKKKKHVGYFQTPEEAARAYDDAAVEHYGEYALTNKSLGLL